MNSFTQLFQNKINKLLNSSAYIEDNYSKLNDNLNLEQLQHVLEHELTNTNIHYFVNTAILKDLQINQNLFKYVNEFIGITNLTRICRDALNVTVMVQKDDMYLQINYFASILFKKFVIDNLNIKIICKLITFIINTLMDQVNVFTLAKRKLIKKPVYIHVLEINKNLYHYFTKQTFNITLNPMVIPPRNWVIIKEQGVYGGYLTSHYQSLLFTIGLNKKIDNSIINKYFIKKINLLQGIPFKFNIQALDCIIQNINSFCDLNDPDYLISSYYQAKDLYLEQILNLSYEDSKQFKPCLKFSLNSSINSKVIKEIDLENYTITKNKFNKMVIILNFIYNFAIKKDLQFYLPIKLDIRTRLYHPSLINPINSKLVRSLLLLNSKNNKDISKSTLDNIKYYHAFQYKKFKTKEEALIYYNTNLLKFNQLDIINNNRMRNPFNFYLFNSYNLNKSPLPTISFDATSSVLQHIAMLLKNKELALLTNLYASDEIQDPYTEIKNILTYPKEDNLYLLEPIIKERSLIKGSIMRYIYGSNAFGMGTFINEQYPSISKKYSIKIAQLYITTFNKKYPEINIFMSFIKIYAYLLAKENKPLTQYINGNKIESQYLKTNKIKLNLNKDIRLNINAFNNEQYDATKTKSTSLPNIIHSLDATVNLNCKFDLFKEGINTFTVHDCFIVEPQYIDKVISKYNAEMVKISKLTLDNIIKLDMDIINNITYEKKYKILTKFNSVNILINSNALDTSKILKSKYSLIPT